MTSLDTQEKKGVFLISHGLNLNPRQMEALGSFLQSFAFDIVYQRDSFATSCALAVEQARAASLPLFFLGYSEGALWALNSDPGLFKKMILFAPPIFLRLRTRIFQKGVSYLPEGFPIPSFNLKEYREQSYLQARAYHQLFELHTNAYARLQSFSKNSVLVVVDPRDEMLDFHRLEKFAQENLPAWKIWTLSTPSTRLFRHYHHLIIDESRVGTEQWNRVKLALTQHLDL